MKKKTYLEWALYVLDRSDRALTTNEVYKNALEYGFTHSSRKSTVLRKFRHALSRCAKFENTARGKLWKLDNGDDLLKERMVVFGGGEYIDVDDKLVGVIIKVIENLIQSNDIPDNFDISELKSSLNSYKFGVSAKNIGSFDKDMFFCGLTGRIPNNWRVFFDIAKFVLKEYDNLPIEVREICKVCN